jgi:uncharacterized Fe-S cluster-containing protein
LIFCLLGFWQRRAECAEAVVDSLRAQSRDFELENINLRAEIQRFQSDLQTQRAASAAETMRFIAEIEKLKKVHPSSMAAISFTNFTLNSNLNGRMYRKSHHPRT